MDKPRELITIMANDVSSRGVKRISLKELREDHRRRYVIHTSLGDVVLKHMPFTEWEEVMMRILSENKDYLKNADELRRYLRKSEVEKLTEAETLRATQLFTILTPLTNELAALCIDNGDGEPYTAEDVNALFSRLAPNERELLRETLMLMQTPNFDGAVNPNVIAAMKEAGIDVLPKDADADKVTVRQVNAVVDDARKKAEMAARMLQK